MAQRKIKEVEAGSMADIAFLLLIFFLVTTTMDTDSGIVRKLPPMPEKDVETEDIKVKERNIFVVLVNRDDALLVEGQLMDIRQLRSAAKEFIVNPANKSNLPIRKEKFFEGIGDVTVTPNHVISLRNDRGTSYGMYIAVQNELAAAYNELRNELALQKFAKKYENLDPDLQDAVNKVYPMTISEAEPNTVGG